MPSRMEREQTAAEKKAAVILSPKKGCADPIAEKVAAVYRRKRAAVIHRQKKGCADPIAEKGSRRSYRLKKGCGDPIAEKVAAIPSPKTGLRRSIAETG